jgi:hypothetical protein
MVDSERQSTTTGDKRTPGTAQTATPPWLVDKLVESADRGLGRSTIANPSRRRRRKATLSTSCQVSTRQKTSVERSRSTPSSDSSLFSTEQMLRQPNVIVRRGGNGVSGIVCFCFCCCCHCRRLAWTRWPAWQPRRRTNRQPDDARTRRHGPRVQAT